MEAPKVIIYGDHVKGFTFIGPFDDFVDAWRWADLKAKLDPKDYVVIALKDRNKVKL